MGKSQLPDHERSRWREELMAALVRERVPSSWRDRLVEELEDHLSDLKENLMSMDAEPVRLVNERLGLPHELASSAATEYRKLGFFARRPVLTYLLGPLVLMPILFVAFVFLCLMLIGLCAEGLLTVLDPAHDDMHPVGILLAQALTLSFRFVPFALFAWLFCWLTRRQPRDWRHVMAACATISVYATVLFASLEAATPNHKGTLIIGFALPPTELLVVIQAMVPLAIGALFLRRASMDAVACGAEAIEDRHTAKT